MVDRRTLIRRTFRTLLAVSLIGLVVWFFASGSHRDVDEHLIRTRIEGLGALGPIVFVLAFSLIQPLGPSGHIFAIAASLVWSPIVAFLLSLAGAVGSQIVGFLFYRYVARDWARELIPERLVAYEDRLVTRPIRTVALIRLFTFTWPLVSALFGVSKLRFVPMVVGTALGLAPTVLFDVLFLTQLLRWIAS